MNNRQNKRKRGEYGISGSAHSQITVIKTDDGFQCIYCKEFQYTKAQYLVHVLKKCNDIPSGCCLSEEDFVFVNPKK